MGLTPIPCIPPQRQYLPGLDGELIDVTGFQGGQPRAYSRFRAEDITPKPDYLGNVLSLSLTACLLALVVLPFLWWLT